MRTALILISCLVMVGIILYVIMSDWIQNLLVSVI